MWCVKNACVRDVPGWEAFVAALRPPPVSSETHRLDDYHRAKWRGRPLTPQWQPYLVHCFKPLITNVRQHRSRVYLSYAFSLLYQSSE